MKQKYLLVLAIILSISAWLFTSNFESSQRAVIAITVLAGVLWFTETLPLWITALLIAAFLVIFAGTTPTKAFAPFFDPIIALLLGGLFLGRAAQKHYLDIKIANFFIKYTGTSAKKVLLGVMAATAFVSLWISNTAAAALLLPVGLSIIKINKFKFGSNYSKAMVLGVGYSATIGGIGTLVGTPPNLIAVRGLATTAGISINFFDWTIRALPLVVIMIPLAWFMLITLYKPEIKEIKVPKIKNTNLNKKQKMILAIFLITVVLWLTESLHGIHNSVISILMLVALFGIKLLEGKDVGMIEWDVLILVGGGLVLGEALVANNLHKIIASYLTSSLLGYSQIFLFFILGIFAIVFTAFVANTAAAAILIPVMVPLSTMLGINPVSMAMLIGIVVSFDFIVPVGTPPNAMAYGTGYIKVRDMIKAGLMLSILGALIVTLGAMLWIK